MDGGQATLDGMRLLDEKQYAEAACTFLRAARLNQKVHGLGHPSTLASLLDYTRALQYDNEMEEAHQFLAKTFADLTAEEATTNFIDWLPLLTELALTAEATTRWLDATMYHARRLVLLEDTKRSAEERVRCLRSLGRAHRKANQPADALKVYSDAAQLAQTELGGAHTETVCCLHDFALACEAMGDRTQSINWLRRAYSLVQQHQPDHSHAALILRHLQQLQQKAGPSPR